MNVAPIHPSQKRLSCEPCRKNKSRCERIQRSDQKCARCTILDVECTAGQQKKVGRPKRTADNISNVPGPKSRSTVPQSRRRTLDQQSKQTLHKRLNHSERCQEPPSPSDISEKLGRSRIAPVPAFDAFIPAPTWPTLEMGSLDQDSLTWNFTNAFNPKLPVRHVASRFDFTAVDAHSFDTTANSLYRPEQETVAGSIGSRDALIKLSEINLDLHLRIAAVEVNRSFLDLNSLLYREGPLFINNCTVAELLLKKSQDYLHLLTRMRNGPECYESLCTLEQPVTYFPEPRRLYQDNHQNLNSHIFFTYPSQPLLAPLALAITSIFTQLIKLYELLVEHLTTRIQRLDTDPIALIPGITFGGMTLTEPCSQGILFSNVTVYLLDEMERALGISKVSECGKVGLLSARQIDVLTSELDGQDDTTSVHGAMRPTHVRKLLENVAVILSQVSSIT